MKTLLLEIGTEEIPAGYIQPALNAMAAGLLQKLEESRIAHGNAKTFGTPRRMAVMVADVADRQQTVTEDLMGPPEKVAFDENGNPRVPAVKFAEKAGVPVEKLKIMDTDKGRYLYARLTRKGLVTKNVLKKILPEVIRSLPFPKTMRWGSSQFTFARPIQTLCALLGKEAVIFELAGIKSNRYTFGHRFLHPGKIKLASPNDYIAALAKAHVCVDIATRRQMIEAEIKKAAETINGAVVPDEGLVDTVTQLVEFPAISVGTFDDRFLELPDEILITAMREHQKYFAVAGKDNSLVARFIVVNNTPAKDMQLVAKGHERVLRARLEDAMFFYKNDASRPLEENVEKLSGVLFQAKLGSMYDKTLRIRKNGRYLAEALSRDADVAARFPDLADSVDAAAKLCKADLVSQVVVEFPKLQGIMGRIYAALNGASPDVAAAIEEHYRPVYSGGRLPNSLCGALLAIADKTDSICGCFSAGLIPSGASDPYALRRQGIGIVQIMAQHRLMFSLRQVIKYAVSLYIEDDTGKIDDVTGQVQTFIRDRMANLLAEEGYSKDVIASVIEVSANCVPELWKKVDALEKLKKAPDFEPLAVAFKRVVNIIKKSAASETQDAASLSTVLFEHPSETALNAAADEAIQEASDCLNRQEFDQALVAIAGLRGPVDDFFDGVMVMTDNPAVRNNRLALLAKIAGLFETVADFSKLST